MPSSWHHQVNVIVSTANPFLRTVSESNSRSLLSIGLERRVAPRGQVSHLVAPFGVAKGNSGHGLFGVVIQQKLAVARHGIPLIGAEGQQDYSIGIVGT